MTRRRSLLLASGGVAASVLWVRTATATPEAMQAAVLRFTGGAQLRTGRISLDISPLVENGNTVPLSVLVDSPMTAADHVAAIHVLATRNPTPGVATFRLTPLLARAEVQTRIRLAEDQRVIVLAQHSDGRVRRAVAEVRVTTGGCLT